MTDLGLSAETVITFAVTATLIELTPGPNMAWLAIVAATEGRRPGYAAVGGVALGLATVGLAAVLGMAAAISASPAAYQMLRWTGILYLLWLAWNGWRGDGDPDQLAAPGSRLARYFQRGLVTNLLNPKAAVFYVAVVPAFVVPTHPVMAQTVTLSLVYVAVATLVHAGIVTAAGAAHAWLQDPDRERIVRRSLSAALALVALWFAWKTRV
jgi:threonine/homoserine/homoserine lactone efflux protein